MLYALNFKNVVAPMFIQLFGFSMHQNIRDEKNFIEFIEKTLNAQLSGPENEPDLLEFVRNHPIHFHSRARRKYNKNEFY